MLANDLQENLYCLHHIWIGLNKMPSEGVFKLYEKSKLYQGTVGQFIPTLCLNNDAINQLDNANVPVKLLALNSEFLPDNNLLINQARKIEHCNHVIAIDLYNDENNLAYIPVFILEDIYVPMKNKLIEYFDYNRKNIDNLYVTATMSLVQFLNTKDYFIEQDTMFNYLNTIVVEEYLYQTRRYHAASDIIRLLLLILKPGCYIDFVDMQITRLPLKSDFIHGDFYTWSDENYFIFSSNGKKIANILTYMYINIRNKIEREKLTKNKLEKYTEYEIVNRLAGFRYWSEICMITKAFISVELDVQEDEQDAIFKEICPNSSEGDGEILFYSYKNKFVMPARQLSFFVKNLLTNPSFKHIAIQESKDFLSIIKKDIIALSSDKELLRFLKLDVISIDDIEQWYAELSKETEQKTSSLTHKLRAVL